MPDTSANTFLFILEPCHCCTSSLQSSHLWNDVLASRLLTEHTSDDDIVTHAVLSLDCSAFQAGPGIQWRQSSLS